MKSTNTKKYHYVYRITNMITGMHYYGSRSSKIVPKEDLGKKYFSTSSNLEFIDDQKENPSNYKYKIVKIFETCREDANNLESKLHIKFDVRKHPKFINLSNQLPNGFSHYNRVTVFDTTTMTTKSVTVENFNKSKKYVGASKGKVTALDKLTNKFIQVDRSSFLKNDNMTTFNNDKVCVLDTVTGEKIFVSTTEFKNNSSLEFHTKNHVTAKNKITGKTEFVTKDEFYNNGNLEHTAKNTVVARNLKTGEVTRVKKSIFDSNDDWISLNLELGLANIIEVYDNDNVVRLRYVGNFETQSKLDKIPYAEFRKSYKSDGEYKLYPHISDGTAKKDIISRLRNNGNIKYAGWYAKIVKS